MRTGVTAPQTSSLHADHRLFEREVACCGRQLYPAALRLTGNPNDAEDLLQETLTRAYMGLRGFTPGSNALAWLHRIMTSAYVNACRKRRREPVPMLSPEPEALPCGPPMRMVDGYVAHVPSAEEEVLTRFAHSEVREALDALPDCFRATVYLVDVQGYSYYDVSELMDVPIGTVMSRLHRARTRLRRQLSAAVPAQRDTESVARVADID